MNLHSFLVQLPILTTLIWLPIVAGGVVLLLGEKRGFRVKAISVLASLAVFVLSLLLYTAFDASLYHMQFVENHQWIKAMNAFYALGVDGISLPLVILTTFCSLLVIFLGVNGTLKLKNQYLAAFLIMTGVMNGVFLARDAVLFYVFFEATLIPMFLIIGIWGGPNRIYASIKFFLYTFLGSVFMLLALIYLYHQTGSMQISDFYGVKTSSTLQVLLFLGFLFAFAVKVPMWPVHTWLPDAHVQAPTGGSVILAAIMLKMGTYGFIRFSLPIVPTGAMVMAPVMIALSLIAVVYIGFVALVQQDMKKLIAYSSIAHMGFVTLGFFIGFYIMSKTGSRAAAELGAMGAMVQMISHGFVSAALFFCVGVLYERVHSRLISDYSGIATSMPFFAFLFVLFAMGNSGLPGTSGFVGEFLVVIAAMKAGFFIALLAGTTLILAPAYTLWMIKRVVYGKIHQKNSHQLVALTLSEKTVLLPLAGTVILFGVWPKPLIDVMSASLNHILIPVFN